MAVKDHLDDLENVNSRHTSDVVEYKLGNIDDAITALKEAKELLESLSDDIKKIDSKKNLWTGKSKEKFDELVRFYKMFRKDYKSSVKKYHSAVKGLNSVANHIPNSKVIKEVDEI